jgi:hypothetical protein
MPSASHIKLTGQTPQYFAMKPNFKSTPSRSRPQFFQQIAIHLELGDFVAQPRYLRLLRRYLAVTWERFLGLLAMLAYRLAQHILLHIQILDRLAYRYAAPQPTSQPRA